jgi:hypothetical protein
LIGAGVGLTLVVVVGIGGLFGWIGSTGRMRRLREENDSLRVQFRRLGELEANLSRMAELNEQMQKMLGVDPPAVEPGMDVLARTGGTTSLGLHRLPVDSTGDSGRNGAAPLGRAGKGPARREAGAD